MHQIAYYIGVKHHYSLYEKVQKGCWTNSFL